MRGRRKGNTNSKRGGKLYTKRKSKDKEKNLPQNTQRCLRSTQIKYMK